MKSGISNLFIVGLFVFMVVGCDGADPDPLTDFAPGVTQFTLRNLFLNGDVTVDTGGVRASTSVASFPAIQSQGLEVVRFRMVPCGVNLPHTHPRATEVLTLISGGPIQVGFVDTRGQAFIDILQPGDVTVFPRGLLHFEINVGTVVAEYISSLNAQSPGVLVSSEGIFRIPARTVATAFNITLDQVRKINSTTYPYGVGLKYSPLSGCVPGQDITVNF